MVTAKLMISYLPSNKNVLWQKIGVHVDRNCFTEPLINSPQLYRNIFAPLSITAERTPVIGQKSSAYKKLSITRFITRSKITA
jgi:hypothetical protein